MRAVLADTGPLYATADEQDSLHQEAMSQSQRLASERRTIVIAYPTMLETYSLILFRLGTGAALRWLTDIEHGAFANPTQDDYKQGAAALRTMPDQRITLVDATIGALALRLDVEVWTYDHHFDVMRVPVWRG